MEDFVLFDMDGTLTLARRPLNPDIIMALRGLGAVAPFGVISGSDFDYIEDQIVRHLPTEIGTHCTVFPCNGTKVRKLALEQGEWVETYSTSMVEEIGAERIRSLLCWLLIEQEHVLRTFPEIPATGTFISNRRSLINWCPVGRQANFEERTRFCELDKEFFIRENEVEYMKTFSEFDGLTIALGGQTSFDIYPDGWDKTYALCHLEGKRVWFVGDRCQPGGNDHAIYAKLQPEGRAFETSGPEETARIIRNVMVDIIADGLDRIGE